MSLSDAQKSMLQAEIQRWRDGCWYLDHVHLSPVECLNLLPTLKPVFDDAPATTEFDIELIEKKGARMVVDRLIDHVPSMTRWRATFKGPAGTAYEGGTYVVQVWRVRFPLCDWHLLRSLSSPCTFVPRRRRLTSRRHTQMRGRASISSLASSTRECAPPHHLTQSPLHRHASTLR